MKKPLPISVIVPTRNRHQKLAALLEDLQRQNLAPADYEILVVDDGSNPPVTLPEAQNGVELRLLRLEGVERCIGRNSGAAAAKGEIILFVDDDLRVGPEFLAAHRAAHGDFPNAMAIGKVDLPETALQTPFGRFRARLERGDTPRQSGPSQSAAFATAQSMSLGAARFTDLCGFDGAVLCIEDQDLAARHLAKPGAKGAAQMVYLADAPAVHFDNALEIRAYFRRVEYGARWLPNFCARYADWPSSQKRLAVNSPPKWGRESPRRTVWKWVKSFLMAPPLRALLFVLIERIEKIAPRSPLLPRLYRLMIGIALQSGFRRGLRENTL